MGNRGYTLLEVLVVLVILGVLSGFVVLSLRGNSETDRLNEAADRVAALVQVQCEEALLGARAVRMVLNDGGYSFEVSTRSGWEAAGRDVLRKREWPVQLEVRLDVDGASTGMRADGVIYCLPTGELTPFELELKSRDGSKAGVRATAGGVIERSARPG